MPTELTEDFISHRLSEALSSNSFSTDGYAALALSGPDEPLKCAAVLMPLVWRDREWHLLFTRRTDNVESHKGQVSFPGGGCDTDETVAEQTALREAYEEIGLRPADVRLLGRLNDMLTITHFQVTPVVGVIPWPYDFQLSLEEVSCVFTIPLDWLAKRENWDEHFPVVDGELLTWPVISYRPYQGEILWGASARMTQAFLKILGLISA